MPGLARKLKKLRKERGWSQGELARRARIHPVYLARLETSKQDQRLSVAVKIARALRVGLDELVK